MINQDRRVYTPPLDASDYAAPEEDAGRGRRLLIAALMAVVALALGAGAWNIYGGGYGPAPLVEAEAGAIKTITPQASPPLSANHELDDAIAGDGRAARGAAPALLTDALLPYAPQAQGAFMAQLAALRSEDEALAAWRALGSRAPDLVRAARMQVQRADLGAQGVFYRLRVGFFDTSARAGAYCERAESLGQDCMVVSR